MARELSCWNTTDRDRRGYLDFEHDIRRLRRKILFMPVGIASPASHETVDQKLHYVHQEGARSSNTRSAAWPILPVKCLSETIHDKDLAQLCPSGNLRIIRHAERLGVEDARIMVNIDRTEIHWGTIPLVWRDAVVEGR